MAATGTEYVTLEQLKDLVTNMIQPLVDAVGTWDKSAHGNVSMAEFCGNLAGDYNVTLPVNLTNSGNNVILRDYPLLNVTNTGEHSESSTFIGYLIGNIMLSAPNGDRTQVLGYLGDNSVELPNTPPEVQSSAALTYAAESGGSTDVPVGTLSVQGEYNQVFKKTENGTEPAVFLLISEDQLESPITATKPFTIIGSDGDVPSVQFAKPNEEGGLDLSFALSIAPSGPEGSPKITASDLASAKKTPMNFNPNGYALILE